jgi:hypothetical protein
MNIITGNLWDEIGKADLILFTANSTLTVRGQLVMGAGVALEAKRHFPATPERFGGLVRIRCANMGFYGIIICPCLRSQDGVFQSLGAFQVKANWQNKAQRNFIQQSAAQLSSIAPDFERIAMNFPGIGAGGLDEQEVTPLLKDLPDNVWIYKK